MCQGSGKLPEPPPRTQGKAGLEGRSQSGKNGTQAPAFPFLLKEHFPKISLLSLSKQGCEGTRNSIRPKDPDKQDRWH